MGPVLALLETMVRATCIGRVWCDRLPNPTASAGRVGDPETHLVPVIQLSIQSVLGSVMLYLKGTISTNGRRVSLLNNTSSLILSKNNNYNTLRKVGRAPPQPTEPTSPRPCAMIICSLSRWVTFILASGRQTPSSLV